MGTEPRLWEVVRDCGDCGVQPGELHVPGCDCERCPACGGQMISCDCIYEAMGREGIDPYEATDHDFARADAVWRSRWWGRRIPWSGLFPGTEECVELGWFCHQDTRKRCKPDDPRAWPDLNRLATDARWDAEEQRFVARKAGGNIARPGGVDG
jgi:hypothetical protein